MKGRILFVEDNMDSNELVRSFMERNRYKTFLAMNGRENLVVAILLQYSPHFGQRL
jgi:DNA-binding response OmpR family regulator